MSSQLVDAGQHPPPFDWTRVVHICAAFAALLFVADMFFT